MAEKASGQASGAEALKTRLKTLDARLVKAEGEGANVALLRRQVEKVGAALDKDVSAEDLERLENLVSRLESSSDY